MKYCQDLNQRRRFLLSINMLGTSWKFYLFFFTLNALQKSPFKLFVSIYRNTKYDLYYTSITQKCPAEKCDSKWCRLHHWHRYRCHYFFYTFGWYLKIGSFKSSLIDMNSLIKLPKTNELLIQFSKAARSLPQWLQHSLSFFFF